ncbi:MAG: NAD(P)H-hydrate dehydratase [Thermoanaerobaculia bacterium]
MRVLNAEEARAFDRWAIETAGVPSLILMENAALAVVDAIGERFPGARTVQAYCGPGNNGGDGLAVAPQLVTRGYEVEILLASFGRPLSNDGSRQLEICQALGFEVVELGAGWRESLATGSGCDLQLDGLFGTGLSRPLAAPWSDLVDWMNGRGIPIVAIDLPSGLDASTGRLPGSSIRAALTVSFAAPRIAHLLPPATERVGELAIGDLGLPFDLFPAAGGGLHLREPEELARLVEPRRSAAHKGEFGSVLLVAGSQGMAGAAVLAARAALVGGAGRVTIATIDGLAEAILAAVPEAMLLPLPANADGRLGQAAGEPLLAALERFEVVALGPGLGGGDETARLVESVVTACPRPLVLDADGLNALGERLELVAERSAATVLTPHPGELGRLLGIAGAEVQEDRLAAVARARERSGAVVVLKGEGTLVARPDGETAIHRVGNPAMASAGAGDVLAGLLAARMAQGDEPGAAADLAVHLHGRSGDLALAAGWAPAIPAGVLIDFLPQAFEELVGE